MHTPLTAPPHRIYQDFPVLSPLKQNCIENIQIMLKILVRVSFLI